MTILIVDDLCKIDDEFLSYCEESGHTVKLSKRENVSQELSKTIPDVIVISASSNNRYGKDIASGILSTHLLPICFFAGNDSYHGEFFGPNTQHYGLVYHGMSYHQILTHLKIAIHGFMMHTTQLAQLQKQVDGMEAKLKTTRAFNTLVGALSQKYGIEKNTTIRLIRQFARNRNLQMEQITAEHSTYLSNLTQIRHELEEKLRRNTPKTIFDLESFLSSNNLFSSMNGSPNREASSESSTT